MDVAPVESPCLDGRLMPFATFDHRRRTAFDPSSIRVADQWDIVNPDTGFRVTHTFASFITNKVWAWIDRNRPVWLDEFGADCQTS